MSRPDRVLLGRITGAHGIRGEVTVLAFTEDPSDIASYQALTDAEGRRPLSLIFRRMGPKGVIANVRGVSDRNGAEALKGAELWVERSAMADPEDDAYYYVDLVGLDAVDLAGETFGHIVQVVNYGAGDLLEIMPSKALQSELVPFTANHVPEVDLASGRVIVAWPLAFEVAQPPEAGHQDDGDD